MALIELRRFDEAIVAGKKALRQNPSYSAAYRVSRPLSPISDATPRRVRRRRVCWRLDPAFTISARIGRRRQAHAKLLIEGLRKAGLPE